MKARFHESGGIRRVGPILILMAIGICTARAVPENPAAPTQSQLDRIKRARNAEELVALAESFFDEEQLAASRAAIESACNKDADLLTSDKRVTPASWNDFWFTARADLRVAQLGVDDAAGRVEIARWLEEGGAAPAARELVAEALDITPQLPDAIELEAKLRPPAGVDLRYALSQPVMFEEFTDERVRIEPRRLHGFLLVPMYHLVTEGRMLLSPTSVRADTDNGRRCRARGLLLPPGLRPLSEIESDEKPTPLIHPPESPPQSFDLTLLYERFQIEFTGGRRKLIWQNTMRSRSSEPGARDPGDPETPRGEVEPNGWAAVLIEYPLDVKTLTLRLLDADPEILDMELVRLIEENRSSSRSVADETELAALVDRVSERVTAPSGVTAQLAVSWLGNAVKSGQLGRGETDVIGEKAEMAFLAALGHAERRVRRTGLHGLIQSSHPLSDNASAYLLTTFEPKALLSLLADIEAILGEFEKQTSGSTGSVRTRSANLDVETVIRELIGSRPQSLAPANLYSLVGICLDSSHERVRLRALRLLLNDGTQQSLQLLSTLSPDGRRTLIRELPQLQEGELRGMILRLLMVRPDPATTMELLEACGGGGFAIDNPNDPLLVALKGNLSEQSLHALLLLLSRCDLSALADSESFGKTLEELAAYHKGKPAIRSALLRLGASHLNLAYQAPVKRTGPTTTGTQNIGNTGAEALLASLIMDPEVDDRTAAETTATLIRSGRLTSLMDQYRNSSNRDRQRGIVRAISEDRELWQHHSAATFLGASLSVDDPGAREIALSALLKMREATRPDDRWQLSLAIKQHLEEKGLVNLTVDKEDRIADHATALTLWLAAMTSHEARDFETHPDAASRNDQLGRLMLDRARDPLGEYACIIYADIEMRDSASSSVRAGGTGPSIRRSVPMPSSKVTIEKTDDSRWQILADGKRIGSADAGPSGGRSTSSSTVIRLSVDASPLLSGAVRLAQKENGDHPKIDILPLTDELPAQLTYDALGTWACEVAVTSARRSPDADARIVTARIVLEPLRP